MDSGIHSPTYYVPLTLQGVWGVFWVQGMVFAASRTSLLIAAAIAGAVVTCINSLLMVRLHCYRCSQLSRQLDFHHYCSACAWEYTSWYKIIRRPTTKRNNLDLSLMNPLPLQGIIIGILILRPLKGEGLLIMGLH